MSARIVGNEVYSTIESIRRVGKLEDLAHAEIFLTFAEGTYSFDPYTISILVFEDFWINAKEGSEVILTGNTGEITGVKLANW